MPPSHPHATEARPDRVPGMPLAAAVAVLHGARRTGEIIITSMGSAREWMRLPQQPLDFVFVPSAMGHATSLALGLALARPAQRVVACAGDGSLLMNLGTLVTISAAAPRNLVVIVFDNGVYEITGAQPTPGAPAGRAGDRGIDVPALAHACGLAGVHRLTTLADWERRARTLLDETGPTLIILDVAPVPGAKGPRSPGPTVERVAAFKRALRESDGHGDRSSS